MDSILVNSQTIAMKEKQLNELYQSYINAFAQNDVEAVKLCYQLPCVLSTPDKVIILQNEAQFDKEFESIFNMLKTHDISAFSANNACYQDISESLTLVKIDWQFFDGANNLFTEFSAIYHLIYQQNVYKIVNVISHDMCQQFNLDNPLKLSSEE